MAGRKLTIAVEGCCHGELDNIYRQLSIQEQRMNKRVDLLIICGDFQAVRNVTDLECMSCPDKYKQLGGFYRYYTGERRAPIPTIFVGGNHEASNHMRELHFGGWVAPNIYYMGASGVVRFGGVRIGGITGIFKDYNFEKGFFERPPFRGHARSAMHHVRSYEVFKMLQIRSPLDIVVSHDWPLGIEQFGDVNWLLRTKPFFTEEVNANRLGSPANALLLEHLRPAWWFSAHMHVRFTARVGSNEPIYLEGWSSIAPNSRNACQPVAGAVDAAAANADEIIVNDEELFGDEDAPPAAESHTNVSIGESVGMQTPRIAGRSTEFLALDKCLPRRQFLEIVDIDIPEDHAEDPLQLEYDLEWLAILRLTTRHLPFSESPFQLPADVLNADRTQDLPLFPDSVVAKEVEWVNRNIVVDGHALIPCNFVPMAPVPAPGTPDTANFGLAARGFNSRGGRGGGGGRGGFRGGRGRGRGGHYGGNQYDSHPWQGPRPDVLYPNPQTDELCKMLDIDDPITQRTH
ncbi:lariat debranching enzyme [Linderina macrospora]|uniref:Lariat debranching enzyme n=1 Tax=Linderina macrospora TaxID=4868 RepID=A0ACC1JBM1_9FUNG|nr:lariat debranching enzyme [Linderina macrospora]